MAEMSIFINIWNPSIIISFILYIAIQQKKKYTKNTLENKSIPQTELRIQIILHEHK